MNTYLNFYLAVSYDIFSEKKSCDGGSAMCPRFFFFTYTTVARRHWKAFWVSSRIGVNSQHQNWHQRLIIISGVEFRDDLLLVMQSIFNSSRLCVHTMCVRRPNEMFYSALTRSRDFISHFDSEQFGGHRRPAGKFEHFKVPVCRGWISSRCNFIARIASRGGRRSGTSAVRVQRSIGCIANVLFTLN